MSASHPNDTWLNSSNKPGNNSSLTDFIKWQDLVVVSVWSLLLAYGLVSNLVVFIAIIRTPSLRSLTSYWLMVSLSVCDVAMILISLCHLMPATLFHERFVQPESVRDYLAIFFYDIFWYTSVIGLAGVAANRFLSIMFPVHYNQWFNQCNTILIIISLYLIGLSSSLPALFECCRTVYYNQIYLTSYLDLPAAEYHSTFDLIFNSFSVGIMVISYSCILYKVRKSRMSTQRYRQNVNYGPLNNGNEAPRSKPPEPQESLSRTRSDRQKSNRSNATVVGSGPDKISKREMRLLLQFFVVSLVFILTFTTWQIAFRSNSDSKWMFCGMTTLFFVNNGINPTIYLVFNTALRRAIRKVFCGTQKKKAGYVTDNKGKEAEAGKELVHMNTSSSPRGRSSSSSVTRDPPSQV